MAISGISFFIFVMFKNRLREEDSELNTHALVNKTMKFSSWIYPS